MGGLYRFLLPLIKKTLPTIRNQLLNTSANILTDVVDNDESFKNSIHKRGRETFKNLSHEAIKGLRGSGEPPKKRRKVQSKSRTRGVKKSIVKAPRKKKTTTVKKTKKSKVPVNARFAYL